MQTSVLIALVWNATSPLGSYFAVYMLFILEANLKAYKQTLFCDVNIIIF